MTDEHPNYQYWWDDDELTEELKEKLNKGIEAFINFRYKDNLQHMVPGVELTK